MGCCSSKGEASLQSKGDQSDYYNKLRPFARTFSSIRESYTILKTLGSGPLGNVFLVKDKRNGLERAAKELIKLLMDEQTIDAFFSELSVLANLV